MMKREHLLSHAVNPALLDHLVSEAFSPEAHKEVLSLLIITIHTLPFMMSHTMIST
jgi:hypothetical protein